MIKYVIQVKTNPLKKEEVKFYPQAAPTTQVTLSQIVFFENEGCDILVKATRSRGQTTDTII